MIESLVGALYVIIETLNPVFMFIAGNLFICVVLGAMVTIGFMDHEKEKE